MIQALGYSRTEFKPSSPGRLCRGRERWIEPFPIEEGDIVHRTVITGATFTDDSAADALRGVQHSGLAVGQLLGTLFQRKRLVAFMEDGHPADIPEDAAGVELYTGHRAGGRSEALMVRWFREVSGIRELRELLGKDAEADRVRGFVQLETDQELTQDLCDALFLLVGMSNLDSPPARFQPAALPEVLEHVKLVILLHRDKHGPSVGIYSRDQLTVAAKLTTLTDRVGALLVRFAIPPMLARWDRALSELRSEWLATRQDEFPVPPAPEQSAWAPRQRSRRGRRERLAKDAEAAARAAQAEE